MERNAKVTGWIVTCPHCGDTNEYHYDPTGLSDRCNVCGGPYEIIAVRGVIRND